MASNLDLILRTKRLREQRAASRSAAAAAEAALAARAHAEAADRFAQHESTRPARESEIYRALLAAPVSARKLRADTALLSGLTAYAAVLDTQAAAAAAREDEAREQAARSRQAQARAARESEAAQAMCDMLVKISVALEEKRIELESEDIPRRGKAAMA